LLLPDVVSLPHSKPGPEAQTARQAPHNIEAEQALLGAILINNAAYERLADQLEAAHFFDPLHGRIFAAVAKLIASGRRVTPVTLKGIFEGERIGALSVAQYLGRLAAHATSVINARDYARTIRELALRRDLILIGEDMVNLAYNGATEASPAEQIEAAEKRLFQLGEHGTAVAYECEIAGALTGAVDMIAAAYQRDGGLAGLPTGFTALDRQLGGLAPSDLIILAGRPSMGKTALATNIAFSVAGLLADQGGGEVSFYSLEMSPEQLVMRQLAQQVGIPSERMRRGAISEAEFARITDGARALAKLPLHIDATGGLTIPQLMTRARRRKRLKDTKLILVDYLQLMASGSAFRDNKVAEVTAISNALKALAKELGVPVIALSQLSRQVENREDKRPQLSDLRESGSIEQDADIVLFVFREEYYLKRAEPPETKPETRAAWSNQLEMAKGLAEVIVGKHRHGPVGTVKLAFSEAFTRFADLDGGKPQGDAK
jgi:replicative DNA helicase